MVNWTIPCSNVPTYLCSTKYGFKTVEFSTPSEPSTTSPFKFPCTRCSFDMHGLIFETCITDRINQVVE